MSQVEMNVLQRTFVSLYTEERERMFERLCLDFLSLALFGCVCLYLLNYVYVCVQMLTNCLCLVCINIGQHEFNNSKHGKTETDGEREKERDSLKKINKYIYI